MSGLYTAWRMANEWQTSPQLASYAKNGQLRIGILEWSDRVGGRLDSLIMADMQNVPAELGGMRFTTSHQILMQVIETFKLPVDDFPMSDNSQFCLRGQRTSEKEIDAGKPVPYNLPVAEQKQTPNQLFNYAIQQICNYQDSWTDSNWQWIKENYRVESGLYKGMSLFDIGFWNILFTTLSNEGYDFVWDGGGYNSNTINWNAAEAMPYMLTDFSVHPVFKRIPTGFHQVPAALANAVQSAGVPIYKFVRLNSFQNVSDASGQWTECKVRVGETAEREATLKARCLFLAMPRHSLELLDQNCEFFRSAPVQYNIQSVLLQPAYKLFLAYDKRWWNKDLFYAGPTITDMQLRMTYDFGSENERGGKPDDTRTLLLASYSDMQSTTFWGALERENVYTTPPSWEKIGSKGGAIAPPRMVQMAEGMLTKVLSVGGVSPTPSKLLAAHYQDWSQDPYGAGFHAWAAHYKAWEVMRNVRKPLANYSVFICGEAYSNAQGWVEGALCTAESILEDFFGMPRLAGVSKDYPLLTPVPIEPGTHDPKPTQHYKGMFHGL